MEPYNNSIEMYEDLQEEIENLKAENKTLRELLADYGSHLAGCPAQWNTTKRQTGCSCGWIRESAILKDVL